MGQAQSIEEYYMPKDGMTEEQLMKGLDKWLDKKFAEFGKWSVRSIAALAFAALVYWALTTHGWKSPGSP